MCNTLIQLHKFYIPPKLCIYMDMFNHISNGLVEKMVDDIGSNFFPQISLLGKYWNFYVRIK